MGARDLRKSKYNLLCMVQKYEIYTFKIFRLYLMYHNLLFKG